MATATLDVVGIGNAIVDVLVQADDEFIAAHGLAQGNDDPDRYGARARRALRP